MSDSDLQGLLAGGSSLPPKDFRRLYRTDFIFAEQVSLQTMPSLAEGLSNALSLPSGVPLQDAGALLALRLTNTEQELSSALGLLRKYTSGGTPTTRLSAAPR